MKSICFYFQVHQPYRLKQYRFFNIGQDHYYYDDYLNRSIAKKVAERCYLPMNNLLLKLIKQYNGQFRVSFSITGIAIEQFEKYTPEVLESFKKLADTGCVEFLAETYAHSLASLKSESEFTRQVKMHSDLIKKYFNQTPQIFRNTELVYSDQIGKMVYDMGYKAILTEGAKHILGWKSPNFLYYNALNPKLKILLKNYQLSDDIAFRFSNRAWEQWPLTAEKYIDWLNSVNENEEIINLFMDYETFGEHQAADTGIFQFMEALPYYIFMRSSYKFRTPTEVIEKHQPVAALNVEYPISWADEERDLTAWLGNDMQQDAFNKLYDLEPLIQRIDDIEIQKDWIYLQASDHFYYMSTKFFSDGAVHQYFNPFSNPYNAFINYMNVLSDFTIRVQKQVVNQFGDTMPLNIDEAQALMEKYQNEIQKLKQTIDILQKPKQELVETTEVPKNVTPKATKKSTKEKTIANDKKTELKNTSKNTSKTEKEDKAEKQSAKTTKSKSTNTKKTEQKDTEKEKIQKTKNKTTTKDKNKKNKK